MKQRGKRMVSVLLALVMLIGLVPGMTLEARADVSLSGVSFNKELNSGGTLSAGNYFLTADISAPITVDDVVNLNLNGFDVKAAVTVSSGARLYLYGAGQIDVAGGTAVLNSGTLTMNGGVIAGSQVGINNAGTLIMNGGEIKGCATGVSNSGTFTLYGGAIRGCTTGVSNNGTFVLYGGEIMGPSSLGISTPGVFYMNGGVISGTVTALSVPDGRAHINAGTIYGNGTGVSVSGNDAKATLNGGMIFDKVNPLNLLTHRGGYLMERGSALGSTDAYFDDSTTGTVLNSGAFPSSDIAANTIVNVYDAGTSEPQSSLYFSKNAQDAANVSVNLYGCAINRPLLSAKSDATAIDQLSLYRGTTPRYSRNTAAAVGQTQYSADDNDLYGTVVHVSSPADVNCALRHRFTTRTNLYDAVIAWDSESGEKYPVVRATGTRPTSPLSIYDGALITGGLNDIIGNGSGGIYFDSESTVNMYGGAIAGNTGNNTYGGFPGGGVGTSGNNTDAATFAMYGGEISKNHNAGGYGGGINVDALTVLLMGGEISENTATNGAGIRMCKGSLIMTDGMKIAKNEGSMGAGVYIDGTEKAEFRMHGGSIESNVASETGGGVYVDGNAHFNMRGGSITGNSSTSSTKLGGGVYLHKDGKFTLDGAVNISLNTTMAGRTSNVYLDGTNNTITIGENFAKPTTPIGVSGESNSIIENRAVTTGWQTYHSSVTLAEAFVDESGSDTFILGEKPVTDNNIEVVYVTSPAAISVDIVIPTNSYLWYYGDTAAKEHDNDSSPSDPVITFKVNKKVGATVGEISYQWYRLRETSDGEGTGDILLLEGNTLSEDNTISYLIPSGTDNSAGSHAYYLVVTNTVKNGSETYRSQTRSAFRIAVVELKRLTITAKNQTVAVNSLAKTQVTGDDVTDYVTVEGLIDNELVGRHTLSSVKLAYSNTFNPANAGSSGAVTPEEAVILDSNGKDVTANYNIRFVSGTATVKKIPVAQNLNLTGEDTQFKQYYTLQEAFDDADLAEDHTIQLLRDVSGTSVNEVSNKNAEYTKELSVNLDLAGHNVVGNNNGAVITVSNGTLTLKDTGTTPGKITHAEGKRGNGVYVRSDASFVMESGEVADNKLLIGGTSGDDYNGGGVCVGSGAEFTMNGGKITGTDSIGISPGNYGCGVFVNSTGTFTMNGGEISGNKSAQDGGGVCNGGTFTMTGGIIENNETLHSGGGVMMLSLYKSPPPSFTMTGGTITENTATGDGGGVYVYFAENNKITLGGTAKVTGNKKGAENENNVFLAFNRESQQIQSKIIVPADKKFESDSIIGVTLETDEGKGVFTTDIANDTDRKAAKPHFSSDNPELGVLAATEAEGPHQLKLDKVTYAKLENLTIVNNTAPTRNGTENQEATYPWVGDVLKANVTDEDGTAAQPVTYQWYRVDDKTGRNPVPIDNATAQTYTAAAADADSYLMVVATQDKDEDGDPLGSPITKRATIGPIVLRPAPTPFEKKQPLYPTAKDGQITKTHTDADVEKYTNLYYSADNGKTWNPVDETGKTADNLNAGTYLFQYRDSNSAEGKHAESKIATVILTAQHDLTWLKLSSLTENKKPNEVGAVVKVETNFGNNIPSGTSLVYNWYRIKENEDGTFTKTQLPPVNVDYPDRYQIVDEDAGCKILAEVTWMDSSRNPIKTLSTPTPIISDSNTAPATLSKISGKVQKAGNATDTVARSNVVGATVELRQGNTVIATAKTNNEGNYDFGRTVPNGEYNIVVTTSDGKIKTERVSVSGDNENVDVLLSYYDIRSLLVVKGNVPTVVVDSLDELAIKEAAGITDGQIIEVKLTVDGRDDLTEKTGLTGETLQEQRDQNDVKAVAQAATGSDTILHYINMDIVKTTTIANGSSTEIIRDTGDDNVLRIRIPYTTDGRYQFGIYRKHVDDEGHETTIAFDGDDARRDGTFQVGNGYIDVYATKFSTYAIGYTTTPPTPSPAPGGGGGGGGGVGGVISETYPITITPPTNGTATADKSSATANAKVTVTATQNVGYKVNTVAVTDKDGKTISVTKNSNGTYSFTMPESAVTVDVTFVKTIASPKDTGVADWLITDEHILYIRGYEEDGVSTVRPDNNITRAEAAMMFYRLLKKPNVPITVSFTDVNEGQWFATPINVLASLGIIDGYGDGTFLPNRSITRAEFAKIATMFASATGGKAQFSDVPENHWANSSIATAADYGWINGYEDGTYRPENFMTRAAAAKIINNMLGRAADRDYVLANQGKLVSYTDLNNPNAWYYFEIIEASIAHEFTMSRDGVEVWRKKTE